MATMIYHDKLGSGSFTATQLVELLNNFVNTSVAEVRNRFPQFGAKTTTISQVAGTVSYSTPVDLDRILSIRALDSSGGVQYEAMPVDIQSLDQTGFALALDSAWKLYFVNRSETQTWTLLYTFRPIRVHYGTLAAVGDTTATLATTPTAGTCETRDDYYNNAQLIDTTNMKVWNITDYVGSTRVATVNWVAATKPSGTPTYEILPLIDCERFLDYLAWGVALSVQAIDRPAPGYRLAMDPWRNAQWTFRDHWTKLQQRCQETIRFVNAEQY